MKQTHLGNGAYLTVNRDYLGQIILTAGDHNPLVATDCVCLTIGMLELALATYEDDLRNVTTKPVGE